MTLACDTRTPVTILRAVAHGPLGIVRSLGRLGVPVYVVDPDPRTPAATSRYCRGHFPCDVDGLPPEQVVEALRAAAKVIGRRSILVPTTDAATVLVESYADRLRDAFLLPAQSPGLAAALSSKAEMYHLARRHGIPTPHTVFPRSRRDVLDFIATRPPFPVMLKGIDGVRLQQRSGARMFRVRDAAELLARYDAVEDPGEPNVMFQEYIPGGEDSVWMFNGYFDARSECLLGFTGKKLRQYPAYIGATCLGICLANPAVDAVTRSFMKAVGYHGILDIGYRYDHRDGAYKVLDINPRIGATFRLFVAENGMDVARALYLDLTGQPVPSGTALDGRRWIVEDKDLISSVRYRLDRQLTVRRWLGSLRGIDEAAYLASDDARPVFAMCARVARELARRLPGARRWRDRNGASSRRAGGVPVAIVTRDVRRTTTGA
jgi:D-aspartate ligase